MSILEKVEFIPFMKGQDFDEWVIDKFNKNVSVYSLFEDFHDQFKDEIYELDIMTDNYEKCYDKLGEADLPKNKWLEDYIEEWGDKMRGVIEKKFHSIVESMLIKIHD
jgi:hypothetical protein